MSLEMKLYEKMLEKNYDECKKIILSPFIDPGFKDNILIRSCPDLKMYSILSWHTAIDTCFFLNKKCCCEHNSRINEYFLFQSEQIKVYEIIEKRNKCFVEKDDKNVLLYDKLIDYEIEKIISKCDFIKNREYFKSWVEKNKLEW